MISKFLGYQIKKHRLEKNMSQEGICKGICTVSYLSKIENGAVNANNEIIEQLFKSLGAAYFSDEDFEINIREIFKEYFEAYFWNEDTAALSEKIDLLDFKLKYSKYAILYELYLISKMIVYQENGYQDTSKLSSAVEKLKFLCDFADYMDNEERFLYYLFSSNKLENKDSRFEYLHKADSLISCSIVMLNLADLAYYYGNYIEALRFTSIGMQRAFNEGYLPALKHLSIIEFNCYVNLREVKLAHTVFERALNFNRSDKIVCASLEYNFGTMYIQLDNYEKAIYHLLKSYNLNPAFLCCQKLALSYIRINERLNAKKFLDEARMLISNDDNDDISLYIEMLKLLEIMLEKDYLDNEEYGTTLENLYSNINKEKPQGYGNFYIPLLRELYAHSRQYKKALELYK